MWESIRWWDKFSIFFLFFFFWRKLIVLFVVRFPTLGTIQEEWNPQMQFDGSSAYVDDWQTASEYKSTVQNIHEPLILYGWPKILFLNRWHRLNKTEWKKSNNQGSPLCGVCMSVCVRVASILWRDTRGLSAWFTDEGRSTSRQFSKEKSAQQT